MANDERGRESERLDQSGKIKVIGIAGAENAGALTPEQLKAVVWPRKPSENPDEQE